MLPNYFPRLTPWLNLILVFLLHQKEMPTVRQRKTLSPTATLWKLHLVMCYILFLPLLEAPIVDLHRNPWLTSARNMGPSLTNINHPMTQPIPHHMKMGKGGPFMTLAIPNNIHLSVLAMTFQMIQIRLNVLHIFDHLDPGNTIEKVSRAAELHNSNGCSPSPFPAHQAKRLLVSTSGSRRAKEKHDADAYSSRSNPPATHCRNEDQHAKPFLPHDEPSVPQPLIVSRPSPSKEEKRLASPPRREKGTSKGDCFSTSASVLSEEESEKLSSRVNSASPFSVQQEKEVHITTYPSKGGTERPHDLTALLPVNQEREERSSVLASRPERECRAKCEAQAHVKGSSVSPSLYKQTQKTSDRLRLKELDLLARDIEPFDPDHQDHNIENYLCEIEQNLADLPSATDWEKIRLIWKTSSRSVHRFIESQPSKIRDCYFQICKALAEEYSTFADETTITAIQVKQNRSEHPREYYRRLRHAFFQGKNRSGLEEDPAFKSLYLHNLHPCVRTQVTLMTQQDDPSMREIRNMTQIAWEIVYSSKGESRTSHLKPTGSDVFAAKTSSSHVSQDHPNSTKGGGNGPQRDSDKCRVRDQCRNPRPESTKERQDSNILAQTEPTFDSIVNLTKTVSEYSKTLSNDNRHISDYISDSDGGCSKIYSSEPRIKKIFKPRSYKGRFSHS